MCEMTMSNDEALVEGIERMIYNITENILVIMEDKDISKKELADRLGVKEETVEKLLSGESPLTLRALSLICHVLEAELNVSIKAPALEKDFLEALVENRERVEQSIFMQLDLNADYDGPDKASVISKDVIIVYGKKYGIATEPKTGMIPLTALSMIPYLSYEKVVTERVYVSDEADPILFLIGASERAKIESVSFAPNAWMINEDTCVFGRAEHIKDVSAHHSLWSVVPTDLPTT